MDTKKRNFRVKSERRHQNFNTISWASLCGINLNSNWQFTLIAAALSSRQVWQRQEIQFLPNLLYCISELRTTLGKASFFVYLPACETLKPPAIIDREIRYKI